MTNRKFRLWAMCCSHVGTDLDFGRESLADAIRQSEQGGAEGGPPFDWDIAVHLGDHSGGQTTPTDEEGREIVRQFGASTRHPREHFYTIVGNHDAPVEWDAPLQWWARKWIDPTGESTEYSRTDAARMPYPVDGTWERYTFVVGNIRFLMMSDRNDLPRPVGRRGASKGGYPSGAVSGETFEWWRHMLATDQDSVLVAAHHHMLKETTVASGPWEGYVPDGQGRLEVTLPRLLRRRRAGGRLLPLFHRRQTGCPGLRRPSGGESRLAGPLVRGPHARPPGRPQGRPLSRRAEVGLQLHQRRGAQSVPRLDQRPHEPPANLRGRQRRGARPVLPAHVAVRAAGVVRPGGTHDQA